jgi:hypothetical protein
MKIPLIEFSYELNEFSEDLSSLLVDHVEPIASLLVEKV